MNNNNNGVYEIDILKLIQMLWYKAWVIVLVSVFAAAIALAGTVYFITPQYTSSVLMYVNNSSVNLGGASVSITSADISAAKSLVDTYAVILKTRLTLEDVKDVANVPYSYEELSAMMVGRNVNFHVKKGPAHPGNVILEIEMQGALNVKKAYPDAVLIFVLPPSLSELKRRLRARGRDTEEQIEIRSKSVMDEIKKIYEYDNYIVNADLDQAVNDAKKILSGEYTKITRDQADEVVRKFEEEQ